MQWLLSKDHPDSVNGVCPKTTLTLSGTCLPLVCGHVCAQDRDILMTLPPTSIDRAWLDYQADAIRIAIEEPYVELAFWIGFEYTGLGYPKSNGWTRTTSAAIDIAVECNIGASTRDPNHFHMPYHNTSVHRNKHDRLHLQEYVHLCLHLQEYVLKVHAIGVVGRQEGLQNHRRDHRSHYRDVQGE